MYGKETVQQMLAAKEMERNKFWRHFFEYELFPNAMSLATNDNVLLVISTNK